MSDPVVSKFATSHEWLTALTESDLWRKTPPAKCENPDCQTIIRFMNMALCPDCEERRMNKSKPCPGCGTGIARSAQQCQQCFVQNRRASLGVVTIAA